MKLPILFLMISLGLFSCGTRNSSKSEASESKTEKIDTIGSSFRLTDEKDTVQNGEEIKNYKSGAKRIRGMMKDGKREGVWMSWYEDGTQWSETTFKEGQKTGATTTWYENGKKRYEGFYTNDQESGKWMYWDENGKFIQSKDYGVKQSNYYTQLLNFAFENTENIG